MTALGATDTYQVEAFDTDDGWWAIKVVGLKFGYTQAAHLDEVEDAARDLIACSLDMDETAVGAISVRETVWS